MKYPESPILLMLIMLLLGCSTQTEPENLSGSWEKVGLSSEYINSLDYAESTLFATSKDQVFKSIVLSDTLGWQEISFEIDQEISEYGDILHTDLGLYTVVRNTIAFDELPEDFKSLFISTDLGSSWDSVQILLEERQKPFVLNRIAQIKGSPLFADWHLIFKSNDGINWNNTTKNGRVGVSEFLYISKEFPNQIWSGGSTNIFSPYLSKSDDGGETWTVLNQNVRFNSESTTYSVVVSPSNEQAVLASFAGGFGPSNKVRKSTNGGLTWKTVLEDDYGILALKNGVNYPNRVYGAGITIGGKVFVAISTDFGDSWTIDTFEEGPIQTITNDLEVANVNGNETLILGTNKGVYSFTFDE